jgi:hypothetical protein
MGLRRTALLMLLCKFLLLQGCAHRHVNEMAAGLPSVGPEKTLAQLNKFSPPDRDLAQYLLDLGLLKLYTGDLAGAQADFELAKQIMVALQATSVMENIGAVTTNETLRAYDGSPSDRALAHVIAALAYLLSGNLDGARVEVLQADVTMQELADGYSVSGQLASVHFLAGIIFEFNDERDNALISYRRAYKIMKVRNEVIPGALQTGLLNLTFSQGFPDEYDAYVAEFGREQSLPAADEGEWLLLYFDGVVTNKSEFRLPVFDPSSGTMVTVVVPEYSGSGSWSRNVTLQSNGQLVRTDVVENIDRRAREDLSAEMPAILAAATARTIAKFMTVKSAQEQNELAGAFATILAIATEQADLRSWNMLPATIQVARLTAPLSGSAKIVELGIDLPDFGEITDGRQVFVFATSLSDSFMTYPVYDEPGLVTISDDQYEYIEVVTEEQSTIFTGEADVSE